MDLSNLVQRIQDERAAIALNIFLDRPVSDDLRDLQLMVSNNVSLRKFTLVKVWNSKLHDITAGFLMTMVMTTIQKSSFEGEVDQWLTMVNRIIVYIITVPSKYST